MISLLQLQYFQVLAEEQHLGRSAEKLYISQTTLSTMISKLERELGVRLFDRNGGSLLLNDCGNGNAGNNPVPEAVENFYVEVQRRLPDTGRRHRLCR